MAAEKEAELKHSEVEALNLELLQVCVCVSLSLSLTCPIKCVMWLNVSCGLA